MELVVAAPQRIDPVNTIFDANKYNTGNVTRWLNGVTFSQPTCGVPVIMPFDPCDEFDTLFPDPNTTDTYTFYPFRIAWSASCINSQLVNPDEKAKFLREVSDYNYAGRHVAIAEGFWNGVAGGLHDVEGLVDVPGANQLTNTGGVVSAFGKLMRSLASTGSGSQGVFHMSPFVANIAVSKQLIYRSGRQLRTVVGDHLVIADGGYPGTGPGGAAATASKEWIYATGPVYYVMSDMTYVSTDAAETTNRRTNEVVYHLDSYALVMWDQCQWFSVPVDLDCDTGCLA